MRKNHLIKSKKHNGVSAQASPTKKSIPSKSRNGATKKSTPSKSRNGATKTPVNGSVGPKTSPMNSTWMDDVKKHPEMERQLKQAIQSFHEGRTDEAIRMLEKTNIEYPDRTPILWYLGGFYRDREQPERAIPLYERATQLSPKLERASLGLFHARWKAGQIDEALEEIKRFQLLTNWSCQDYLDIMAEIKEKWLDDEPARPKARKKKKP
jgi:tetratricopeptide (TPR) repeat protein